MPCSEMLCALPQERLCPSAQVLSFALFQTPKLSPSPGFYCLLGDCQWGVSLPLHCLLEISPSPSWLGALSPCLVLGPQSAHGPLSHLGKSWMAPAFGLLAEHLPADFFSIFFPPLLSLEAEITSVQPCVPAAALGKLHWGRLEGEARVLSCSG